MIINNIVLHNFGVYAGRQSVELTPPSANKPVVLFGGLNGGGKTTFLDAIQLCLFGPFAKCSNRGTLGYEEYLNRCINKNALEPEAAIELSFSHRQDGEENHYTLHRSWKKKGASTKENFEVIKNGKLDAALMENWNSQVEDFIPLNISSLFLFDGEKIESYANQESASTLVHTAIQNLLGLDIVEQLQKDLSIFERKKQADVTDPETNKKIEEEEGALKGLHERLICAKQECASLKTHKIEPTKKKLAQIDKEFIKKGGHLYAQKEAIEKEYKNAVERLKEIQDSMRLVAEGGLPLSLTKNLLISIKKRDHSEEESRISEELVKAIEGRDRDILKLLKKENVSGKTLKGLEDFLDSDHKKRKQKAQNPRILKFSNQARAKVHDLLSSQFFADKESAQKILKTYSVAKSRAEKLELEFLSIPTGEDIAALEEKRTKLREEISRFEHQFTAALQESDRLTAEIEKRKQSLLRTSEKHAVHKMQANDITRFVSYSNKAKKTLDIFKKEVVKNHIKIIEQLILESYQQLIRKTSFITDLKINPETFDISLYAQNGETLTAERLSAGERQLLAIAILWGLAKASGRPLPTAIDTPLGRLDSAHRENIVSRYFPFASHQVLLFSTDQEIVGGYLDSIKPWVGRSYVLEYETSKQATEIREGYFAVSGGRK